MAIQSFTNLDQYYDDPEQFGQHQYVTIKDMVNNFMFSQDDDSLVANVDRNRVVYHAKRVVQELYFDVLNEVISIEFDLNPTLIISLPHDYVTYVRISWVDDRGKLHPLAIDETSNLAQAYLQDNEYEYLFDDEGDILQGSHIQDTVGSGAPIIENDGLSYPLQKTPNFNTDRSKIFKSGSYRVDKERGIMQFSSKVDGRTIVLDYISDGLFQRDDADIRIHKFAEQAAYNYIFWRLIEFRRNVPANRIMLAEKQWWNMRRIAKRRIKPIRYEELRQVMKSQTKMIKD